LLHKKLQLQGSHEFKLQGLDLKKPKNSQSGVAIFRPCARAVAMLHLDIGSDVFPPLSDPKT